MQNRKYLSLLLPAVLLAAGVAAQSRTAAKLNSAADNVNSADTAVSRAARSVANSARTLQDMKSLLKSGNENTTVISIAGIDYDDENLSVLKENIKKVKGVRSVTSHYKSGAVMMEVSFKGKPTDLWDEIPKEQKRLFKLVESEDNHIILEYKNAKQTADPAPAGAEDPPNTQRAAPGEELSEGAAVLFSKAGGKLTGGEKNRLYRETGFLLSKDRKQFIADAASAGHPFDAAVYPVDLNKDGMEEVFIVWGNTFTSGAAGSSVNLYIRNAKGDYMRNLGFPGCCPKILATTHLGFPDLLIGGPGMQMPVWRWNGKEYDYYKTIKDEEVAKIKGVDVEDVETVNR